MRLVELLSKYIQPKASAAPGELAADLEHDVPETRHVPSGFALGVRRIFPWVFRLLHFGPEDFEKVEGEHGQKERDFILCEIVLRQIEPERVPFAEPAFKCSALAGESG